MSDTTITPSNDYVAKNGYNEESFKECLNQDSYSLVDNVTANSNQESLRNNLYALVAKSIASNNSNAVESLINKTSNEIVMNELVEVCNDIQNNPNNELDRSQKRRLVSFKEKAERNLEMSNDPAFSLYEDYAQQYSTQQPLVQQPVLQKQQNRPTKQERKEFSMSSVTITPSDNYVAKNGYNKESFKKGLKQNPYSLVDMTVALSSNDDKVFERNLELLSNPDFNPLTDASKLDSKKTKYEQESIRNNLYALVARSLADDNSNAINDLVNKTSDKFVMNELVEVCNDVQNNPKNKLNNSQVAMLQDFKKQAENVIDPTYSLYSDYVQEAYQKTEEPVVLSEKEQRQIKRQQKKLEKELEKEQKKLDAKLTKRQENMEKELMRQQRVLPALRNKHNEIIKKNNNYKGFTKYEKEMISLFKKTFVMDANDKRDAQIREYEVEERKNLAKTTGVFARFNKKREMNRNIKQMKKDAKIKLAEGLAEGMKDMKRQLLVNDRLFLLKGTVNEQQPSQKQSNVNEQQKNNNIAKLVLKANDAQLNQQENGQARGN